MKSILFRADGNGKWGLGHIVRCLALADELENNNLDLEVVFITKYEESKKIIEEKDYNVVLATDDGISQIRNLADEDTLVITDFLDTDNQYISEIKKITGLKVISIDNNTKLKRIDADILINANVFDEGEIKAIGSTRYFLGPKYMILRKKFEEAHEGERKIKDKVETILVMFGGTDPRGFTIKVVNALTTFIVNPRGSVPPNITKIVSTLSFIFLSPSCASSNFFRSIIYFGPRKYLVEPIAFISPSSNTLAFINISASILFSFVLLSILITFKPVIFFISEIYWLSVSRKSVMTSVSSSAKFLI